MCFGSTYLRLMTNITNGRLPASSQWIAIGKWQLRWKKSTRNSCNTTWWRILGSLHGHISMSCSFGLIFLQRKSKSWKLLIGPSVGGTTRMPHPPTTFRGSHQGCCGWISYDWCLMEPCTQYAKMGLVQREAWPWGLASTFTTSCTWLVYLWFIGFVSSVGLPSTNTCLSFLGPLHTWHQAEKRTLTTTQGNPWPCIGRKI
jgi:hypothetical protein